MTAILTTARIKPINYFTFDVERNRTAAVALGGRGFVLALILYGFPYICVKILIKISFFTFHFVGHNAEIFIKLFKFLLFFTTFIGNRN